MRTPLALGFVAAAVSLAFAVPAMARDNKAFSHSANPLTMAVFGDEPYGTSPADTAQFGATPGFIDSINRDPAVRLV